MNVPESCGHCKYGNTYDLSVDDLCTYCFITGYEGDWCDFPYRKDSTSRMRSCPLPNLTSEELEIAEKRLEVHEHKKSLYKRILHGKTKLIRKRNWKRLLKLCEKTYTGNITRFLRK